MGVEARLKALSDAQRIDLRRRRDMCQGVMQASASFFAERARLQHTLDARKKRIGRREMLFLGAIVAGAILHWFLIQGKEFQFSLGILVMLIAALWWLLDHLDAASIERNLARVNCNLNLLLATWVGAGAFGNEFWRYGRFADAETGEIDWDSDKFHDWWSALQETLFDAVDDRRSVAVEAGVASSLSAHSAAN
jgi:hypothetical protein